MTVAAVASLVVGIVIGFVGQRSRMCFIGGIRDWILVRDTFLLKGLVAFGLVAWIAFPLSELAGGVAVGEFGRPALTDLLLTVAGGIPPARPRRPGIRRIIRLPRRVLLGSDPLPHRRLTGNPHDPAVAASDSRQQTTF